MDTTPENMDRAPKDQSPKALKDMAPKDKAPKEKKRRKALPVAPTLLTLAGAACGFGAITIAARVVGPELDIGVIGGGGQHLVIAALLIFGAVIFDCFDGRVARLTNQTSEFGAQLDSLCDALSFGVAPAFLFLKSAPIYHDIYHPRFLWVVGLMFTLCAILRLARFNVQPKDQKSKAFTGLPSPAAAGVVASFIFAAGRLTALEQSADSEIHKKVFVWLGQLIELGLPVVVLAAACLMVSRFRYPHFGSQILRGRLKFQHVVGLIFAIAAVFAVHELALPIFLCYYMLSAPVKFAWREATGRGKAQDLSAQSAK